MSALPSLDRYCTAMTLADLDAVAAIERVAYEFPWNRRNFEDSLRAGYLGVCLRDADASLIGYSVLMPVVDEMHLLNVCVAPERQHSGGGLALLDECARLTRLYGMAGILLEVRPSNLRAIRLYEQFGFVSVGMRKNYYPARDRRREDAIVMRLIFGARNAYSGTTDK
ncbi:MAG: ribosomal protein S18-alanine N-acetyltransferase [Janthinobacterium lividum]